MLRGLVLDQKPLVHLAARGRDFKLRIRVAGNAETAVLRKKVTEISSLAIWIESILPINDQVPSSFVSLDKFLRIPVAFLKGTNVTVGDLIQYCANKAGGSHYDPDPGRFASINDHADHIIINGEKFPLYHIKDITKVLLEALMPLYERLRC